MGTNLHDHVQKEVKQQQQQQQKIVFLTMMLTTLDDYVDFDSYFSFILRRSLYTNFFLSMTKI